MPSLIHKRGTRAQIDAAAGANVLRSGEIYLMTDEARLTVGTGVNTHQPMAREGEGGGGDAWIWQKLAADAINSTAGLTVVPGLSFTALANTTYLVDVIGTFQSAATTTGIAVALDIPSGSISGLMVASISATGAGSSEQISDSATTGATSGVRATGSNTPLNARFILATGATGGVVQLQFRSEIAGSAVTLKAALTVMGRRVI